MPIDLWGSLPSTDDRTPRERRETEARRAAFREADLLPRIDARLCSRCGLAPRKGDGRECGACIADRALIAELRRVGAVGVVLTKGLRRDAGTRLIASGRARWATATERKAARARLVNEGTMLLMPVSP